MRDWTISAANRAGKPFSRWACVLAVATCGALAGPAIARAASSPPGLGDAEAQIQSALAQVDTVAPGAGAAVRPAVDQAFAMAAAATAAVPQAQAPPPAPNPTPAAAPPAPPAPPPATVPSPAEIVSNAVAPVLSSVGIPAPVPVAASPAPRVDKKPAHTPISLATRAPAATAAAGSAPVASVTPAAAGAASRAAALTTPQAAPAGESTSARSSQRGRSSGAAPAGAVLPAPLPPVPPGPNQDLTAPAQAGGAGQLVPLLVAALAAALALTRFPFRTRLLPRLAFRKPRRVVLAVWHPG
jgi:outer membrane biosynthesis protein TonB